MRTLTPSLAGLVVLLSACSTALSGCSTVLSGCSTERGDLPDWSEGYETTDSVTAPATGAYLKISTPTDLGYETLTHPDGDWVSECVVATGGTFTDYQQLTCYIEVKELDLYASSFEFSLEGSGCDYVAWNHFMYEAWEVGIGETEVYYEIDVDGSILNEQNSYEGRAYCPYNYYFWNVDAPNCCVGEYNLTIYDHRTDETESYKGLSWDGRPSQCYSGAAFIDPDAIFSDDGWPMAHIVLTNGEYYTTNFAWDPLSTNFFTNVNLANHFVAADHDDKMPAGHAGQYAQTTYAAQCLDHAEEELARIDVIVREWNEEAEFLLEETGDPETEGTEPVSGSPLNDRNDWADATPGSQVYIRDAQ